MASERPTQMSQVSNEGLVTGVRPVIDIPGAQRDSDPFAGSREGSLTTRPQTPPRVEIGTSNLQPQQSLHMLQDSPTSIGKRADTGSVNSAREHLNPLRSNQHRNRDDGANPNNGPRAVDSGLPIPSMRIPPPVANTVGESSERATGLQRARTIDLAVDNRPIQSLQHPSINRRSAVDWIVPSVAESHHTRPSTVAARLQPTINVANEERNKYAVKAKWTGWTLNAAIGLQVLLGSLTTGLSAVATTGRSAAVNTTILGALSTIVASYLARARGSNEPELSITRVKDLDQFIRECEAFKMDHGHVDTNEFDEELEAKRRRFEELLGNANGERKLSPPV